LLFIKSNLRYKEVNIGIVIIGIIYNKLANSTTKIILSITDLILVVVRLLRRDINRLVKIV